MTPARGQSVVVVLDETTKVGEARRRTTALAGRSGFDDTGLGRVALVATEAATNLIKHGGGGEFIVQAGDYGRCGGSLDILALDSGGGMSDVSRCLSDGYSTAGSPGTGLGAIQRLADEFEIYSDSGRTVLWARLHSPPHRTGAPLLDMGVVSLPVPGELVCGDDWAMIEFGGCGFVLVVDGLGHGPAAAQAAAAALSVFRVQPSRDPVEILRAAHSALESTRGAALAIARLDPARRELRYVGVGNIAGVILNTATGDTTSLVSQNGTVGHTIRRIQAFDYSWTQDSLLLMHSDGLANHWNFDRYPGLAQRHPGLIAGVLYRDHNRGRDDVTVLAARQPRGRRE